MDYLITFLEGIVTFVSPCLLPMLPIYIAYFAGSSNNTAVAGTAEPVRMRRMLVNACGFVLGFTIVYLCLGAFAGAFGGLLTRYSTVVNLVCGIIVIIFGLSFAGFLNIPLLQRTIKPKLEVLPTTFPSAVLFGFVFSIGWTPCVGAYLGSALMLASTQGSAAHGIALLLVYSLGLGVPFVISALAIEKLTGAFNFLKRHYNVVNMVCGILLVLIGVLMETGQMNLWLAALSVG